MASTDAPNGEVHRSILWVNPMTQVGLALLFVAVCTGGIFWFEPEGWGILRKVVAGALAGVGCYFSIFNNRIIVTYFGDLPDNGVGGADE